MNITYEEFEKVDFRSGTVIRVEFFPEARKSAYKIWVDFGEQFGVKQTSAQVTDHYTIDSLLGKQVIGCINLSKKKIAGFDSEFLLVGFPDENHAVCLATVDLKVPNGQKLF